jgi:hypothetical protein
MTVALPSSGMAWNRISYHNYTFHVWQLASGFSDEELGKTFHETSGFWVSWVVFKLSTIGAVAIGWGQSLDLKKMSKEAFYNNSHEFFNS